MPRSYDDDDEDDDEEEEEIEYVLFQGALDGTEADLKANAKLVKLGLMEAKELVTDAVSRRASICVLEPKGNVAVGRVVIDTIPFPAGKMPAKRALAVTQMIKLLSGMDINDRKSPQTGGMNASYEDVTYKLYVKTEPVGGGLEKLTIQIVNDKEVIDSPSAAGFTDELKRRLRELMSESNGLVIVCGPPGTGTTVTMQMTVLCVDLYIYTVYSLADHGHADLHNVSRFERKEEHDLEMTFDRMLRMDADWVYLDPLTNAEIVKSVINYQDRAGFLAEVPAPDPSTAIAKLIELAGDPAAVAKTLRAIVTQRPIRLLCEKCRQAYRPNPKVKKSLGLPEDLRTLYRKFEPPPPPEDEDEEEEEYDPCEHCNEVGFRGRTNMFELIEINEALKQHIASGFDPAAFRKLAREQETTQTLQSDGMRLVISGRTALEELQRVFRPPGGAKKKKRPGRR